MNGAKSQKENLNKIVTPLFFGVSIFIFIYLFRYYLTGIGGPTLLVITFVPMMYIVITLNNLRKNAFYPKLGLVANLTIGGIYIILCLLVIVYLNKEFTAIRMVRLGSWNNTDIAIGTIMFLLVIEYSRRKYFSLFILNLILMLYAIYGYLIPGLFRHSGLSFLRILTAMSIEISTGIFSSLPQIGLTLIGAFMLIVGSVRGFGCVDSIIRVISRGTSRSPHILPQSATLSSFLVGAVSGSGAANAAATGSVTIPSLISAGFPRVNAAAIETAASLGGQLLPPVMGIAAFLMADFMSVSYLEVVARGYAPAIIYFIGVSVAVYLLTGRYKTTAGSVNVERANVFDKLNFVIFLFAIVLLIYMMGATRVAPMIAARRVFVWIISLLSINYIAAVYWKQKSLKALFGEIYKPFLRSLEAFISTTSDLTLLLSIFGILTGAFVITGVPPKIGIILMRTAGENMVLMVLIAFLFGYVLGMGLPTATTYILVAMSVAPFMIEAGIDPWVVHFFAFFLGVFANLSPPTSLLAAVTSEIAEADFVQTIFKSLETTIPLFILMGAIFTRPGLLVDTGMSQIIAFIYVLTGTIGIIFSIHCKYSKHLSLNILFKLLSGLLSLVVIFHPNLTYANMVMMPIIFLITYGFVCTQREAKMFSQTVSAHS